MFLHLADGRPRPSGAPRPVRARAPRSQGQALVELALILPLFLVLFVAALDLGRLFYSQITVNDAAREGALEASRNPTSFLPNTACTSANRESNRIMCRALNEARGGFVTVAPADVALACTPSPCPTSAALGRHSGRVRDRSLPTDHAVARRILRRPGRHLRVDILSPVAGRAQCLGHRPPSRRSPHRPQAARRHWRCP